MNSISKSEIRNPEESRIPNLEMETRLAAPFACLDRRTSLGFRISAFGFLLLCACLAGGFAVCLRAGEPSPSSPQTPVPAERTFAESDLLELLTSTLQTEKVRDKGELELRLSRPWTTIHVPNEPLTLKILELPNAGVTPSFIVRFELRTPERSIGSWQLPLQARVMREVWVARSALKRGDSVAGADIARERRDVLSVRDPLADFTEGDSSLEMAEPLQTGSTVLARSVKLRPVVHRGQLAEAIVQDGALSVAIKVEVLEDGAPGQIIRARNLISRRDVQGKVLNEQTLLIPL
jgi:flagellar basal body P-ring formation protein FlgA